MISGRSSEELPQLASELLAIGKSIVLMENSPFSSRVGGLFLIYGLYFKQPTKYILFFLFSSLNLAKQIFVYRSKICITLNEFKELTKFVEELKQKSFKEPLYVFQKLVISNAFLFCATSNKVLKQNLEMCIFYELNLIFLNSMFKLIQGVSWKKKLMLEMP